MRHGEIVPEAGFLQDEIRSDGLAFEREPFLFEAEFPVPDLQFAAAELVLLLSGDDPGNFSDACTGAVGGSGQLQSVLEEMFLRGFEEQVAIGAGRV